MNNVDNGLFKPGEFRLRAYEAVPGDLVRAAYSDRPPFIVLWNVSDPDTRGRGWRQVGIFIGGSVKKLVFTKLDDDWWVFVGRLDEQER